MQRVLKTRNQSVVVSYIYFSTVNRCKKSLIEYTANVKNMEENSRLFRLLNCEDIDGCTIVRDSLYEPQSKTGKSTFKDSQLLVGNTITEVGKKIIVVAKVIPDWKRSNNWINCYYSPNVIDKSYLPVVW
jgi:hypothetical protein